MHLFSYDFFQVAGILHKIVIITYKYNMKKIDIKKLLFYILIPLISGAIVGIITSGDMKSYNGFVPGWIFPVVWSILYILMGISSYLVREDDDALNIYLSNSSKVNKKILFYIFCNNRHKIKMLQKFFNRKMLNK